MPQTSVNAAKPPPSQCHIVVVVLWSRLGSSFELNGRRWASGTEWEYEDAASAKDTRDTTAMPHPSHTLYRRHRFAPLLLPLLLAAPPLSPGGCAVPPEASLPAASAVAPLPRLSQPANVGDAKRAATAYRESGAYARDLAAVAAAAADWVARRAPQVSRPALVLDIDETALSNWEVIQADDFGRIIGGPCTALPEGPCGWAAWDQLGRSRVIEPTLDLYRRARAAGVAVFFITGRPESQRAATERNLRTAGYEGWTQVVMVPNGAHFATAAAYKAPVRAGTARDGYTIIANVGDQPSDLEGGGAEQGFLLPNPFYRIP
jgi:acid phosphatase